MQAVIQTVMGAFGAAGYSILFNVRGRKLIASIAGAAASWGVYLVVFACCEDKVLSLLGATLTAGILSEILARILKAPVIILLVPMLIPLIPGSDLYYATTHLVMGHAAEFGDYSSLFIKEAGAIAFGIILVTCMVQVILKIYNHFK